MRGKTTAAAKGRVVIQSSIALLVIGFLALLGIVGMTLWLGERAQVSFKAVVAERDVRSAAVELRYALQTAESSQRGYLVTGNQIYLAPYSTARSLAERQLEIVKKLLAGREDTRPALARLERIIADKFAEMDGTIAAKRDRRDADAMAEFRTNRGKALMDEANVFFSGLIRGADERLTKAVADQTQSAALLRLMTIIGGIVIVIVVGIVVVTVLRYTREVAAARDEVSQLNRDLDRRVRERTADLARVNEEIQRFAYIVTHDLRAPLVNIMGFTSELETGVQAMRAHIDRAVGAPRPDDPVAQEAHLAATVDLPEAIGFIRTSTRKMDGLINAILKLSREGRRVLRPERLRLDTMIRSAAEALQHQFTEADATVTLDLADIELVSDLSSLEHVFGNLLDNAVKYRAKDRPLRLRITSRMVDEKTVAIDVADNGRGIAPQDHERIFELFRRSGPQDQPGEGIGLSQVRIVLRNLGGDITVTSTLDEGTVFHITLPVVPPASEGSST